MKIKSKPGSQTKAKAKKIAKAIKTGKPVPRKKVLKPEAHTWVIDKTFYDSMIEKATELGKAQGLLLATQMIKAVSPYAHMGLITEITAEAVKLKTKWGVL